MMRIVACALFFFWLVGVSVPLPSLPAAQAGEAVDQAWLEQHYTKSEHMVPMRDGTRLYTAIYAPKNAGEPQPIILERSNFWLGPYGENLFPSWINPGPEYLRAKYVIVHQNVRGAFLSEGQFVHMTPHRQNKRSVTDVDESTDGYDTIDWLVKNVPNNNGFVCLWGGSYNGFFVLASMVDAHPALRCAVPQAPSTDLWYDDIHHHGAFFLAHGFWELSAWDRVRPQPTSEEPRRPFKSPTPDGYAFFMEEVGPLRNANGKFLQRLSPLWNDSVAHPNRDDFWQQRNILPHLRRVAPAVLVVGGWFDAEDLYGSVNAYRAIERLNPEAFNILVMGPWQHAEWQDAPGEQLGNVHFGGPTGPFYREEIQRPFLDFYLRRHGSDRDGNGHVDLPEAWVFQTGLNQWRAFDRWPPAAAQERLLYLGAGGKLTSKPPTGSQPEYDEFVSDPAKPVPYTQEITLGMTAEYMVEDQRFAARRPDVLMYQTEPLEEPITLAGPLEAELWVSTSQNDADWVVKLIDVHPGNYPDWPGMAPGQRAGGYQMMIRSEVIRGRFRNDPARPKPFTPNRPTLVRLPLLDVLHTFERGHRIMVQIQSTWFPLVDRNPQKWVDNIFLADARDFVKATHRIYRSAKHPTRIRMHVLPEDTGQ